MIHYQINLNNSFLLESIKKLKSPKTIFLTLSKKEMFIKYFIKNTNALASCSLGSKKSDQKMPKRIQSE
ncbi:hypothetical protein BpHYR1_039256 [Brachionus plicatilis]|uniref:Uncharacterized protein n=1 Tax=Brachionus plicatilis TaxID=10195 RepID=A0A3M7QMG1_BRAPC|nr:hypothetical protein BpHYR1_039256 [Brachionus plicatilis]